MRNNMKILDVQWFNEIGIVTIKTEFNEVKSYIGKLTPGFSEDQDIKHIINWGTKVHPSRLKIILEHYKL